MYYIASYQDWPGYEAKQVYTCHWYYKLLVLLYGDKHRQCLMHTYLGFLVSMPDNQKVMLGLHIQPWSNVCLLSHGVLMLQVVE